MPVRGNGLQILQTRLATCTEAVYVVLGNAHAEMLMGNDGAGAVIRRARRAAGLSLTQLGMRCGYSASQISRYERGVVPLTGIRVLRRFAEALHVPPRVLGLSDTEAPTVGSPGACDEGGDDPVRRRRLLATLAATAASTATPRLASAAVRSVRDPGVVLSSRTRDAMLGLGTHAADTTLDRVREQLADAHAEFHACRYGRLADHLPRLITNGQSLAGEPGGAIVLAEIYTLVTRMLIKLDDQQLAWMAADRTRTLATGNGAPLVAAEAARNLAVLARKAGWYDHAASIALAAADHDDLRGNAPDLLAERGLLIQSAAYTAAKSGDRARMREWTDEAARIAGCVRGVRLRDHGGGISQASVELHRVSAEYSIGEPGAAVAAARRIRVAALPSVERRSRYWTDVARAYAQWGRRDDCLYALLAAERTAPEEIHARPAVRDLVSGMLLSGRTTSELRGLAVRCGIGR